MQPKGNAVKTRVKESLVRIALVLTAFAFSLFVTELMFRVYQRKYHYTRIDAGLGGRTRADFTTDGMRHDAEGKPYRVLYTG
ncbi:hypothetical protein ACFL2Q_03075 [Thermodesulfobacteriota bacterium]